MGSAQSHGEHRAFLCVLCVSAVNDSVQIGSRLRLSRMAAATQIAAKISPSHKPGVLRNRNGVRSERFSETGMSWPPGILLVVKAVDIVQDNIEQLRLEWKRLHGPA